MSELKYYKRWTGWRNETNTETMTLIGNVWASDAYIYSNPRCLVLHGCINHPMEIFKISCTSFCTHFPLIQHDILASNGVSSIICNKIIWIWTMLGSMTWYCTFVKMDPLLCLLTEQIWIPSSCSVQRVHLTLMGVYFYRRWHGVDFYTFLMRVMHSQTHTHTTHTSRATLDSCRLEPGKLSLSALQGVPPKLIVTFPYRTRWHLVDFLSPIILSGRWLFLISCVMVCRNSVGPGEGKVWGTAWNISDPMAVSAA